MSSEGLVHRVDAAWLGSWEGVGGGGYARLLGGVLLAFTLQWLVWQLPVAAYDGGSCAGLASRTAFMRS